MKILNDTCNDSGTMIAQEHFFTDGFLCGPSQLLCGRFVQDKMKNIFLIIIIRHIFHILRSKISSRDNLQAERIDKSSSTRSAVTAICLSAGMIIRSHIESTDHPVRGLSSTMKRLARRGFA
jgi:hypothetical protein